MTKFKLFAVAALVAVVVAVGGLVAAPSALAKPKMTCAVALQLSRAYIATGDVMFSLGHSAAAAGYYGRAEGIVEGAC